MAQLAIQRSGRKIPLKQAIISVQGELIEEEWV
jgi:hypothetical protein